MSRTSREARAHDGERSSRDRRSEPNAARFTTREARHQVDHHFGCELAQLRPNDRYRRGDLAQTLLARLGVSLPIERWQRAHAQDLLGANYERVAAHGLVLALDDAGVAGVLSIRERLIATARTRALTQTDLADAQHAFQRDAAITRDAELDWLAANLHTAICSTPGSSEADARRQHLLNLWFNTSRTKGRRATDGAE